MTAATLVRVMIVDDSAVARAFLRRALGETPEIEVVACVSNGQAALDRLEATAPDVIILDLEMPVLNGLEALPKLLQQSKNVKVVIASTLSRPNAEITLSALEAGAADFSLKPRANDEGAIETFAEELRRKVIALGKKDATADAVAPPTRIPPAPAEQTRAIAIGSSTGGPHALAILLKDWRARGVGAPVFITQHMPAAFTGVLAEHIGRTAGVPVGEAVDGEPIADGHIYLAPGDRHLMLKSEGGEHFLCVSDGPPVNFCRPSVDIMFTSLAEAYGPALTATVLTGMGRDGLIGAQTVKRLGGRVIVQDQATSVVWGMPGAIAKAGVADAILPLAQIGGALAGAAQGAVAA